MRMKRFPWAALLVLVLGFGLGLTYAWAISPVQYIDAEPSNLRDDFKDHFRSSIAAAYASNADLERARARLALLGDPDPSQALAAQAQRMLAAGEPPEVVQQVALLAAALQGQMAANPPPVATDTPTSIVDAATQPADTSIIETGTSEPTIEVEPTNTSISQLTATPRPTQTATATLGAPFQLVGQDTICETELAEGLLQFVVTNTKRQQIPGAEIVITWSNGEERVFTGFKPELGHGYADFLMTPNVIYSARMADGGTSASDLSSPTCTDTDGNPYQGGLLLTFQQP